MMTDVIMMALLSSVIILNLLPSAYGARLFISEYVQNNATTWAIEIFNPSCYNVEQSSYALMFAPDGGSWLKSSIVTFSSGTMAPNSTYIVCSNFSCDQVITSRELDGDDAVALLHNGIIIDTIGWENSYSSAGWDIAGVRRATSGYSIVRKAHVESGTTKWSGTSLLRINNTYYSDFEVMSGSDSLGQHHFVSSCPSALVRIDCGTRGNEAPFAEMAVGESVQIECDSECLFAFPASGQMVFGNQSAFSTESNVCLSAIHGGLIRIQGEAAGFNSSTGTFVDIPQSCSAAIDIAILLDTSSGISIENYTDQSEQLAASLRGISLGRSLAQVAVYKYGSSATQLQAMSHDPEQVFDAILNIQSWSGSGGNRNLESALQEIDAEFENNGRFGIHKLVIVVAAGSSSVDASSKAIAMKSAGVTIVLVEIQSLVQSPISSFGSALLASSFSTIASDLSTILRRRVSELQNCRNEHHLLTSAEQRPLFVFTKGGYASVIAQKSTCVHSLPASASFTFTLIGIQELNCTNDCNNHGLCNPTSATCDCTAPYFGDFCSLQKCMRPCYNGGSCNSSTGECSCVDGFRGASCELRNCSALRNCSDRGVCDQRSGTCQCHSPYFGADCSLRSCAPRDCGDNGVCDYQTGRCACYEGFFGEHCAKRYCPSFCSGFGSCDFSSGQCTCASSFGPSGSSCRTGACANDCSNHGRCDELTRKCACVPGYIGHDCSIKL